MANSASSNVRLYLNLQERIYEALHEASEEQPERVAFGKNRDREAECWCPIFQVMPEWHEEYLHFGDSALHAEEACGWSDSRLHILMTRYDQDMRDAVNQDDSLEYVTSGSVAFKTGMVAMLGIVEDAIKKSKKQMADAHAENNA